MAVPSPAVDFDRWPISDGERQRLKASYEIWRDFIVAILNSKDRQHGPYVLVSATAPGRVAINRTVRIGKGPVPSEKLLDAFLSCPSETLFNAFGLDGDVILVPPDRATAVIDDVHLLVGQRTRVHFTCVGFSEQRDEALVGVALVHPLGSVLAQLWVSSAVYWLRRTDAGWQVQRTWDTTVYK